MNSCLNNIILFDILGILQENIIFLTEWKKQKEKGDKSF